MELWIGGGRTGERQFGGAPVPAREKDRTFRYPLGLADEGEEVLADKGGLQGVYYFEI
jgi:hypothetical protein